MFLKGLGRQKKIIHGRLTPIFRAALRPAHPIKRHPSAQRTQSPPT
jgi:hypothetical protein